MCRCRFVARLLSSEHPAEPLACRVRVASSLAGIALRMTPDNDDEASRDNRAGHGHIWRILGGREIRTPADVGFSFNGFGTVGYSDHTGTVNSRSSKPWSSKCPGQEHDHTVRRARDSNPGRREVPPQRFSRPPPSAARPALLTCGFAARSLSRATRPVTVPQSHRHAV